ncbi:tripartite tricarboxylate transporter substrate binding protein [Bordetella sp. BOR01]|uniref:tripartite tricarboxylate transporter substrate binding protein n=1 Tax=Bordetella sp. BOR01 TaxID=2854779 RepID=UPI0021027390|nr:tripartite tricarboxylate transporter substrate binding protein [Bordetella sp. BOR01]
MKKKRLTSFILAVELGFAATQAAAADAAKDYPQRPITIVVPFGAGGSADVYARYLGDQLQKRFGQSVVVENKPGGGGVIGTASVARAQPDGYTLLVMSNTQTVNETLLKDKPYDLMKDFEPIAPINEASLVLVTKKGLDVSSVKDLIALEKQKPGALNYASSGIGTPYHIAGELFSSMAKTDVQHVPYKSSGQARTGVAAGEVDYMFDATATMKAFVDDGRVKALATTGKERSPVFPDIPTVSEAGLPGYEANIWLGMLAPKGTPPEVVSKLNQAISQIAGSAEVKQQWMKDGVAPMVMDPQAFKTYLQQDIERLRKIALDANMVQP